MFPHIPPKVPPGKGNVYYRVTALEKLISKLNLKVKSLDMVVEIQGLVMNIIIEKITLIKDILKLLITDPTNGNINELFDDLAEEGEFIK